jgi:7-cyano-7-deazaguanine synthase
MQGARGKGHEGEEMSKGKRAVVLLSGGIDSTTTLAMAREESFDVYALSFHYGQRHKIELEFAEKNARKFKAIRHLMINFNLRDIGGSALTSDLEVPKRSSQVQKRESAEATEKTSASSNIESIPVTYVPARNTIFLSFALGWAETLEASDIFIGANAIDYSGYPDCRPEFIEAFEKMANLATKASVEGTTKFAVHAPLVKMTKGEIIQRGADLGIDHSLTWSCYDPQARGHRVVPCFRCDSCRLRAKGFLEAGLADPLAHYSRE